MPRIVKLLLVALFFLAKTVTAAPLQFYYLTGVIGKSEPTHLFLVRNGNDLSGSYYYESQDKTIYLTGNFAGTGNLKFTLMERTNEKHTGTFEGSVQKGGNWRGTWKGTSKPIRVQKFDLKPELDKDIGMHFPIESFDFLLEKSPICEIQITAFRPLDPTTKKPLDLVADSLNSALGSNENRTFCKDPPKDQCKKDSPCTLDSDSRVMFASRDILSFEVSTFAFSGGAHGSGSYYFFNFDLLRKRKILLPDLIEPNHWNEFKKFAAGAFKKYLRQIDSSEKDFAKMPDLSEKTPFFMTPASIFLFYDEDAGIPHAVGSIQIELSRDSIKKYLKVEL